jgi:hypothetical protein
MRNDEYGTNARDTRPSSFIIHHSSFIIHHSSFIIHHLGMSCALEPGSAGAAGAACPAGDGAACPAGDVAGI